MKPRRSSRKPDYGRNLSGNGRTVGVGVGQPDRPAACRPWRAAAIGDCVARVLDANGWNAKREFYYNDAGVQIENLALSAGTDQGIAPDQDGWPEGGYRGEYIADVARAYMAGASVDLEGSTVVGAKDPDDMQAIRRFAVAYLRNEQNLDLAAFGVDFDIYFLEARCTPTARWQKRWPSCRRRGIPTRRAARCGCAARLR